MLCVDHVAIEWSTPPFTPALQTGLCKRLGLWPAAYDQ